MIENEQRQAVLREAETWLGTKFHWNARVKGAGVDCAHFIAASFEVPEVFKAEDWGFFPRDWHLNTDEESYLFRLRKHASELETGDEPLPATIIIAKLAKSRVFSHGGIVVDWPKVIYVHPIRGVVKGAVTFDPVWMGWEKVFLDPWKKMKEKAVVNV